MADLDPTLDEVRALMDEYYERFHDSYPTYMSPDDSYAEVCQKIQECLDRGEPLEYDDSDAILY